MVIASDSTVRRAAWMAGGWGLMHHYNKSGVESLAAFNELTDRFDVDKLAEQMQQLGVRWFILCVCHNASSPFWCAPNATLERYAPEPVCSRRDLMADLAAALTPRGIHLMGYIWPWTEAQKNERVQEALAPGYPARWCEVLREYSQRWGKRISGWWVDGAGVDPEANLTQLAAALRTGNPDTTLCFNAGWGKLDRHSANDDFCAGEHLNLPKCPGHEDRGALRHLLNPIGGYWGGNRDMADGINSHPVLKFSDDQLAEGLIDWTVRHRAAITLDVPLQCHTGTIGSMGGVLPELYYNQLATVEKKVHAAREAV